MQTNERKIDGKTFYVNVLDAFAADDLLVLLGQLLGPGVVEGIAAPGIEDVLDMDLSDRRVASIVRGVVQGLRSGVDRKGLRDLTELLRDTTTVILSKDEKGKLSSDSVYRACFDGNPVARWKWMFFALEVQLRPFSTLLDSTGAVAGLVSRFLTSSADTSPTGGS